jgi:AraC family transcriptional regulator, transcriptional activator of pobA
MNRSVCFCKFAVMDKLFRIIEINAVLAEEIASGPKIDHFHDFEELIIVSEGSLTHYIDFKVEVVKAPFACYVSMGKMHRLEPQKDLRGWVINYKTEFIPDSKLNFYSNFFTFTNVPLEKSTSLIRFSGLCRLIYAEYKMDEIDYTTIRHLVNGLISMFDGERNRNIPVENEQKNSQIAAFNNFLAILEKNFTSDAGVSFYAGKMNMSERNLNIICRNNFRMSITEIIETRKLIEAKRMLMYTDKTVSEIGFELGYNEKSYFTRVFHARMDITPSRYREMTRSIIS